MGWIRIDRSRITPAGCLPVSVAFNAIGKRVLGNQKVEKHLRWTGAEANYRDLGEQPAPPHDVFEGENHQIRNHTLYNQQAAHVADLLGRSPSGSRPILDFSNWAEAVDEWRHWETFGPRTLVRRNNTLFLMAHLAAAGRLQFAMVDEDTGKVRSVDKNSWNCPPEHALDRLNAAALNSDKRWLRSRPARGSDLPRYLNRFDIPLFVREDCLAPLRRYLDRHLEIALRTSKEDTPFDLMDMILDRFGEVEFNVSEEEAEARRTSDATVRAPTDASTDIHQAWAKDAAARGVGIGKAGQDAYERMGGLAPNDLKCRALLRTALEALGKEVKRGRPRGSKSHWNKGKT